MGLPIDRAETLMASPADLNDGAEPRVCPEMQRDVRRILASQAGAAPLATAYIPTGEVHCPPHCPGATYEPVTVLGIRTPFTRGVCGLEVEVR